jgi:hypothetical protein
LQPYGVKINDRAIAMFWLESLPWLSSENFLYIAHPVLSICIYIDITKIVGVPRTVLPSKKKERCLMLVNIARDRFSLRVFFCGRALARFSLRGPKSNIHHVDTSNE